MHPRGSPPPHCHRALNHGHHRRRWPSQQKWGNWIWLKYSQTWTFLTKHILRTDTFWCYFCPFSPIMLQKLRGSSHVFHTWINQVTKYRMKVEYRNYSSIGSPARPHKVIHYIGCLIRILIIHTGLLYIISSFFIPYIPQTTTFFSLLINKPRKSEIDTQIWRLGKDVSLFQVMPILGFGIYVEFQGWYLFRSRLQPNKKVNTPKNSKLGILWYCPIMSTPPKTNGWKRKNWCFVCRCCSFSTGWYFHVHSPPQHLEAAHRSRPYPATNEVVEVLPEG